MNVCAISGSYPPIPDGVGDYTQVFFQQLCRHPEINDAILITSSGVSAADRDPKIKRVAETWTIREARNVVCLAEAIQPDVISIQYPANGYGSHLGSSALPWMLRRRMPRVPIVATLHEFTSRTIKGRLRLLMALLECDRILAVDRQYHHAIASVAPWLSKRMRYIPIGSNVRSLAIDSNCLEMQELRRSITGQQPVLTYFGVVRREKGVETLLRALGRLTGRFPALVLFVVGEIDRRFFEECCVPVVKELRLEAQVRFVGRCDEAKVSRIFSITDVCVLPFPDGASTKRGSLMAAIEHGQAIVTTTPIHTFPELLDGKNVLLAKPEDADSIADRVTAVATRPELRARLMAGAHALRPIFAWEQIVGAAVTEFACAIRARHQRD